jgi:glycosyltransferase involved in cell wall biosynthesis
VNISFVSDAVYPYNKGGKEKRLHELSTRLSKRGHDVHIYTMHWWFSPELDRVEDGVTLHAISRLYPMYSGDRRSIKEGLLFALACFKLFKVNFEILDVDSMPFFPIFSCWLVCLLRRKKFYATWHEALSLSDWTDYMGTAGVVAALIERLSIQLPHNVIAASGHTGRMIRLQLHRARRVTVNPSGVDTQMLARVQPATTTCDVLYTGRFVKDKNVDKLVSAIAIVAETNPAISCIIVGHGIEKPVLQKQIQKLKLSRNVTLIDPLPKASDVYGFMKAAKVFCLPSVREGFGIVALEALACGTPVVTTDAHANAAQYLIDGTNGTVITLSPPNLATAIKHWIDTPRRADIADRAAPYDWDAITARQAEIYML